MIWSKSKKPLSSVRVPDETLAKNLDKLTPYLSYFRAYPDMFIDMISASDCPIKLFFYQRMFLRICMRYKYVFVTFNRAFAKSFLSIMILYLKCMFYPGIKLFVTAGGNKINKEELACLVENVLLKKTNYFLSNK